MQTISPTGQDAMRIPPGEQHLMLTEIINFATAVLDQKRDQLEMSMPIECDEKASKSQLPATFYAFSTITPLPVPLVDIAWKGVA